MSRGCPGGERRGLIRSPLKSLMDGSKALHLLLAPSLGHGLTPKPVAGWPSSRPFRLCRLFAAPGGEAPRGFEGRSRCAVLPWHLRPAPRRRLRGSPGPFLPCCLQAQAKGRAAGKRDWEHEPEPNAEINRGSCLFSAPSRDKTQTRGLFCLVLPPRRGSRNEEPAVARPGSTRKRGNAPVSGAPGAGAGWRDQGPPIPGTGLRRRFQHVYVQGGGTSASPGEPPCPHPGGRTGWGPRHWGGEGEGTGGQAFLPKPRGDISGRSGNAFLCFPGSL